MASSVIDSDTYTCVSQKYAVVGDNHYCFSCVPTDVDHGVLKLKHMHAMKAIQLDDCREPKRVCVKCSKELDEYNAITECEQCVGIFYDFYDRYVLGGRLEIHRDTDSGAILLVESDKAFLNDEETTLL